MQKEPPEVFYKKKLFLEISQKLTVKHLSQSLFLNKVAGLRPVTLLQKNISSQLLLDMYLHILAF